MQVLLNAGSEDGAGRSAAILRESPEEQSAADFPSGVLDDGQVQPFGLLPVAWDIIEILGIGADLLKQGPLRFDVCQILLALVFAATLSDEPVLPPNALQCVVADPQVELTNQAAGAKGGQRFTEFEQLRFAVSGSLVRLAMPGAGPFCQPPWAELLVAAQPLADGGHGGGKEARRGLDAPLLGALHQTQAMVVSVFHFTHQIEIAGGSNHDAVILAAARRPALPPAGRPSPSASFHSSTSTSPGGYDVTGLFQCRLRLDCQRRCRHDGKRVQQLPSGQRSAFVGTDERVNVSDHRCSLLRRWISSGPEFRRNPGYYGAGSREWWHSKGQHKIFDPLSKTVGGEVSQ